MRKLRSTYDGRLVYKKTSYEERKDFLKYDSLDRKIVRSSEIVFVN